MTGDQCFSSCSVPAAPSFKQLFLVGCGRDGQRKLHGLRCSHRVIGRRITIASPAASPRLQGGAVRYLIPKYGQELATVRGIGNVDDGEATRAGFGGEPKGVARRDAMTLQQAVRNRVYFDKAASIRLAPIDHLGVHGASFERFQAMVTENFRST